MDNTFETVVKICAGYEHNDAPVIIRDKHDLLYGDLGLDSLAVVEIVMLCEKEFGIALDDEAVTKMIDVNDLVNLIDNAIQKTKWE